MNKLLLLMGALALSTGAYAAQKAGEISNVSRVTASNVRYENPRWSPDGTKLAFSNEGYDNLYVMDVKTSAVKKISSMAGIGYGYQWSADGAEILVRDTRWEEKAGGFVRHHAIFSVGVDGKAVKLTEDAEYMQPAAWRYSASGKKSIVAPDAKIKSTVSTLKAVPARKAQAVSTLPASRVSFIADGEALWVVNAQGARTKIYNDAAYCPVLSPDGKKVAFNAVDDVCIMNVDGTGLRKLGRGFNPAWVNDNQIMFELTTDDGHTYTSGELYLVTLSTGRTRQLTATPNRIEMQPVVSPDGSKVAFISFTDGQIYVGDLK